MSTSNARPGWGLHKAPLTVGYKSHVSSAPFNNFLPISPSTPPPPTLTMQPIRPKLKKIILTGFVACMSLFGTSSAAPVPRTSTPADATATSPSPSGPACSSPSPSRQAVGSASTSTDNPATSESSTPSARPPSFSLGLGLNFGPIDYAAAGIARRVSRIFVRRMSAQSAKSATTQSSAVPVSEGQEDLRTLTPVVESEYLLSAPSEDREKKEGFEGERTTHSEIEDENGDSPSYLEPGQNVPPEIRGCRFACF